MPKRKKPTEPFRSRKAADLTQVESAALLGVHHRTWESWEAGVNAMPPHTLLLYRHLAGLERIPFQACKPPPEGK